MSLILPDLIRKQHDIYQRYRFLHNIIKQVFEIDGAGPLRILDVGSGASRLTEAFIGSMANVTRAEVDTFGEPDIVVVKRDGSFPFADEAFDLVIGIEVLEHVQREVVLAEYRRVARCGIVVCCPVADWGAPDAEAVFSAVLGELAKKDNDFLREHRTFRLLKVADIENALTGKGWHVEIIPNGPLDQWLVFNLIDLVYAYDFGVGAKKDAYNEMINRDLSPILRNSRHYRQFFIAAKDPNIQRRAQAFISRQPRRPSTATYVADHTDVYA